LRQATIQGSADVRTCLRRQAGALEATLIVA